VGKIRLTGQADLTVVHPGRVNIGPIDDIQICLGLVFGNLIYDIVYSDHCGFSLDAGYWSARWPTLLKGKRLRSLRPEV
jgi:hypothetical protein